MSPIDLIDTHTKPYKLLAAAVLRQCVRDIRSQKNYGYRGAEWDVMHGGCDIYFEILDLPMSRKKFVQKTKGIDNKPKK